MFVMHRETCEAQLNSMHEDTDAIQSLRCPLYVQSQLKLVTESCLSRSRVTSLESTFGCFWARYGFGEQCGTYTKNCNFGRGNDDRPLELRGNYLLSDTAMMVISHADVVRECLISEDPPKPMLCWVSLIQMKLQGAPPQVFGLQALTCAHCECFISIVPGLRYV